MNLVNVSILITKLHPLRKDARQCIELLPNMPISFTLGCIFSGIGHQYGPFSEHLMMAVTDVFSRYHLFHKMTELILGYDACSTMYKMRNRYPNFSLL